jgi:hypothetical protein
MACKCFERFNAKYKEFNGELNYNMLDNPPRVLLATLQIKTGRGQKKPPHVVASYCPFCGEKYEGD